MARPARVWSAEGVADPHSLLTREDLRQAVEDWVATRRVHYAGSCRFVLGGSRFDQDDAVLAEDGFADEGLASRIVARLEALGFGELSAKAKANKLSKLDAAISAKEGELFAARKREALQRVEREFAPAGEAA